MSRDVPVEDEIFKHGDGVRWVVYTHGIGRTFLDIDTLDSFPLQ